MAKIYRAHLLGTQHHSKLLSCVNSWNPPTTLSGMCHSGWHPPDCFPGPHFCMTQNDATTAPQNLRLSAWCSHSLLISDDVFQPWGSVWVPGGMLHATNIPPTVKNWNFSLNFPRRAGIMSWPNAHLSLPLAPSFPFPSLFPPVFSQIHVWLGQGS